MMKPLWEGFRIPVITVVGEPGSGKTMFCLCIDEDCLLPPDYPESVPRTLIWDLEGSSASYEKLLNFKRIDVPREMLASGKHNYQPIDVFQRWKSQVLALTPGKYRVVGIDTVTEIEEGITAYVRQNPTEFGYTAGQFAKLEGLVWGVVKSEWKRLLMILSDKVETIVLTAHMRDEFKSSRPTGRRVPKGKETIKDVTSVYLILDRSPLPGTRSFPLVPSARVVKSRLVTPVEVNGRREFRQTLPPNIDNASPDGIRRYLRTPCDVSNLNPKEVPKPDGSILTEEDRILIAAEMEASRAQRAQAELAIKEMDVRMAEVLKKPSEKQSVSLNEAQAETVRQQLKPEVVQDKPKEPIEEPRVDVKSNPPDEKLSADVEYKIKRLLLETRGLDGAKQFLKTNYGIDFIKDLPASKGQELLNSLTQERSTQQGN